MSLATRCTSCGTTFRVVQDQLRVSDGWVRCGRCDTVFDALEALIDLDADSAAPLPAEHLPARASSAAANSLQDERETIDIQRLLERADESPEAGTALTADELDDESTEPLPERPQALASRSTDQADRAIIGIAEPASPPVKLAPAPVEATPAVAIAGSAAFAKPAFLRDADRTARWNSPAMRAALLSCSLILLLLLLVQLTYHNRDSLAARSPFAASLLHSACARWNCSIAAPRSIRELAIESSSLSKIAGQPKTVKLSISLRNRSDIELAVPAVELHLTDIEGKLIAKKALLPNDFQVDPPNIASGSELPLQLLISAGEQRIAGYTVELFYP